MRRRPKRPRRGPSAARKRRTSLKARWVWSARADQTCDVVAVGVDWAADAWEKATGEVLDALGSSLGLARARGETDQEFRQRAAAYARFGYVG